MSTPPAFPFGECPAKPHPDAAERAGLIAALAAFPAHLRATLAPLTPRQLGTRYFKWTIRQIVNHIADSHANGYVRTKWALTEDRPAIKVYLQWEWSQTPEADADPALALAMLETTHARWVDLWSRLDDVHFAREYTNPTNGRTYTLGEALGIYAWHGRHHASQIEWMRKEYGW